MAADPFWQSLSNNMEMRNKIADWLKEQMEQQYAARLRQIRATVKRVGGSLESHFGGIRDTREYNPARFHIEDWKGRVEQLENFRPSNLWFVTRSDMWWNRVSFVDVDDYVLFRLACT